MVVLVVLAVAVATLGILAILAIALIRHLKVLARSLKRFQEEAQPILLEIQRQSAIAQDRQAGLRRSGGRLRDWNTTKDPESNPAPGREA
jgi:hypothetical protein